MSDIPSGNDVFSRYISISLHPIIRLHLDTLDQLMIWCQPIQIAVLSFNR